jgi:hypothetical protein
MRVPLAPAELEFVRPMAYDGVGVYDGADEDPAGASTNRISCKFAEGRFLHRWNAHTEPTVGPDRYQGESI